jgi:hypothetical protein
MEDRYLFPLCSDGAKAAVRIPEDKKCLRLYLLQYRFYFDQNASDCFYGGVFFNAEEKIWFF